MLLIDIARSWLRCIGWGGTWSLLGCVGNATILP